MKNKTIGIIVLIVTLIITLIVILFYDFSPSTQDVEITKSNNIDSILSNNKQSIITDKTVINNKKNPFITQMELDSLALLEQSRKRNSNAEEAQILETINNINQPVVALNNIYSNVNDTETDSLFQVVANKIRNRDNTEKADNSPSTQNPKQSALEMRRNSLSQSWNNNEESNSNLVHAVIHKTQTIKNSQTVNIRTKAEFTCNNTTIPKNTLITGVANFSNNRLMITIHNIRINNNLVVANIAVFGSDGIAGLEVSTNEIKKSLDEDATQEISSEVNSALSKVGNQVGKIVGSLVGQTIRTISTEKQQQITLIDNQSIYLSIK